MVPIPEGALTRDEFVALLEDFAERKACRSSLTPR